MCLLFVFLLITRVAAWLRLSRREEAWKTAEILNLCHQLAVLQRRQPRRPKLNWADRAVLAALLGLIPKARRQRLRLLVTPDTILRWHAGIRAVLCNARTPRMNAIAERWIGGCRRELLDRTLIRNRAHLRRILRDYEPVAPACIAVGVGQLIGGHLPHRHGRQQLV